MSNTDTLRRLLGFLNDNSCDYELRQHAPYGSSEEATRVTGVAPEDAAKSLLYKTVGGYVLAVLPAAERVSSGKLRRALDVRDVKMASPDELDEVMGCAPGTCHPLGVLAGVRTVVDSSLAAREVIGFSTGDAEHTVVMPFSEYERVAGFEPVDITTPNGHGSAQ